MSEEKALWTIKKHDDVIVVYEPDGMKAFFMDDDYEDAAQNFIDVMNGECRKDLDDFDDNEIRQEYTDRMLDDEDNPWFVDGMDDRSKMDFLYDHLGDVTLEDLERLVSFKKAR